MQVHQYFSLQYGDSSSKYLITLFAMFFRDIILEYWYVIHRNIFQLYLGALQKYKNQVVRGHGNKEGNHLLFHVLKELKLFLILDKEPLSLRNVLSCNHLTWELLIPIYPCLWSTIQELNITRRHLLSRLPISEFLIHAFGNQFSSNLQNVHAHSNLHHFIGPKNNNAVSSLT